MASENETVADIVKEIRQVGPYAVYKKPIFKDVTAVSEPFVKRFMYGHFVTDFGTVRIENPKVKEVSNYELADRIEAAHRREVAELKRRLKVAEDALAKLQDRFVSSVHDGTIDPYAARGNWCGTKNGETRPSFGCEEGDEK